jgi:hypothetical protein
MEFCPRILQKTSPLSSQFAKLYSDFPATGSTPTDADLNQANYYYHRVKDDTIRPVETLSLSVAPI